MLAYSHTMFICFVEITLRVHTSNSTLFSLLVNVLFVVSIFFFMRSTLCAFGSGAVG